MAAGAEAVAEDAEVEEADADVANASSRSSHERAIDSVILG